MTPKWRQNTKRIYKSFETYKSITKCRKNKNKRREIQENLSNDSYVF